MANIAGALKDLQLERGRMLAQVKRLDQAITMLRKLGGTNGASGGMGPRRIMSVAARRKIAAAQKLRWARWKQKQAKAAA